MKLTMRDIFLTVIFVTTAVAIFKAFAVDPALANPSAVTVTLNSNNFSAIRDEVNDGSINNVLTGITSSDPSKPYYIVLDSPGGSVFAGRRLVSYLLTTDRNIVCIGNTAISMAFVIMQACPVRLVTHHGVFMSHQIASGAKGSLNDMKAALTLTQKLADLYDNMMAARLGLTLEAYRTKINPEFWMVGAKDVLDNRAADYEVKVSCTKELEKSFDTFGEGKDVTKVSKCPIA